MARPRGRPNLRRERYGLFLREYFNCDWNGKLAYQRVYGNCKPTSAQTSASILLAKPEVRRELKRMIARVIKRADITEEKILTQYQEAYDIARDQSKTADMVSATTAQAKLVGMLKERIEHGAPGEFEHYDNISEVLKALSEQLGPEAALRIGEAVGVTLELEAKPVVEPDQPSLAEVPPASDAVN